MDRYIIAILCSVGLPLFLSAQVKTLDFTCSIHESSFSQHPESAVYVVSPDGTKTAIPCDEKSKVTIPLEKEGYYKVFCRFETKEFGLDTLSKQVFFCEEDVIGIHARLVYDKEYGFLLIQRILKPDPRIALVYSSYSTQKYYRGPFFTITNNSPYTVYGRYLPGYFWGEIARIQDGVCGEFRTGTIDYTFVDKDPLFPGKSSDALVGSFGINLAPGTYRYELIYIKDPTEFDASSWLPDDRPHRWACSVKDGYKISYDFEIKGSDFTK